MPGQPIWVEWSIRVCGFVCIVVFDEFQSPATKIHFYAPLKKSTCMAIRHVHVISMGLRLFSCVYIGKRSTEFLWVLRLLPKHKNKLIEPSFKSPVPPEVPTKHIADKNYRLVYKQFWEKLANLELLAKNFHNEKSSVSRTQKCVASRLRSVFHLANAAYT